MGYVQTKSGSQVDISILRQDDTGTYKYIGEAEPGTATSDAAWSITRITLATGDIFVANRGTFDRVWDNRASLVYA